MRFGVVILAAGASQRFGQPKQLLMLNGETLVHRAVRVAEDAGGDPIVVVLGANHEQIASHVDGLNVNPVVCERWQEGMGASIGCGIDALPADVDAAFVLLCDQPGIKAEHLRQMLYIADTTNQSIVAAGYNGTLGAPCLFRRTLFTELKKLPGDKGARHLIQAYRSLTATIDLPEAARDIDTQADYEAIKTSTSIGLNE